MKREYSEKRGRISKSQEENLKFFRKIYPTTLSENAESLDDIPITGMW